MRTLRALLLPLAAAAALGIAGCFLTEGRPDDNTRAGGTIETTNGIVVMPDGRPAARVKVFLLDDKSWLSNVKEGKESVYKSAETDDEGRFQMERDTSDKVSFMANAEGHGVLIPNVTAHKLKNEFGGTVKLKRHVQYQGQITEPGALQVFFAGTPLKASVDPAGQFLIPNVPPGRYTVVLRRTTPEQSEEYVTAGDVEVKDTVVPVIDTLKPEPGKSVVLENFDKADNRSELGPILGDGYWIAYSDYHLGGNSRLSQPLNGAPQYWSNALVDGGAPGRESVLEVAYEMGTLNSLDRVKADRTPVTEEKPYPYVYVAVNLGGSTQTAKPHFNLSGMDTLSFWARGSGSLILELIQNPKDIPLHLTAGKQVTLTDSWTRFSVPVAELAVEVQQFPASPASYRAALETAGLPAYAERPADWAATGGKFRTVRVLATGGTSFQIDDIRFHGIVLDDLVK